MQRVGAGAGGGGGGQRGADLLAVVVRDMVDNDRRGFPHLEHALPDSPPLPTCAPWDASDARCCGRAKARGSAQRRTMPPEDLDAVPSTQCPQARHAQGVGVDLLRL